MDLKQRLAFLNAVDPWDWPADRAPDDIRAGLADDDDDVRLLAAQIANEIMDDELADHVFHLLQTDTNAEVCGQLLIAFGPLLEDSVVNQGHFEDDTPLSPRKLDELNRTLRMIYHDPNKADLVRRKALETAVRGELPWVESAVRGAYAAGDDDWTATAIFCMGFLPGYSDIILRELESTHAEILYEAVRAAGHKEMGEAAGILARLVRGEGTEDLRAAAMIALAQANPTQARSVLRDYVEDPNPTLRETARIAIDEAMIIASLDADFHGLDDFDDDF